MEAPNSLLILAIVFGVAYAAQKVTERLKLPTVTGYIVFGVLLGSSLVTVINAIFHSDLVAVLDADRQRDFSLVADLALVLVAFAVGSELDLEKLKRVGKSILFIAVAESFGAFILVALGTLLVRPGDLPMAMILGAVASATAPAATVMVIRQYRSAGPLTTTILGVVGIDDAVALMIYAFAAAIARSSLLHSSEVHIFETLARPVIEILAAVAVGGALGFIGSWLFRKIRMTDQLLTGGGALLLLAAGLSKAFSLSPLLMTMALGMTLVNRNRFIANRLSGVLENLSPLFCALFFIFGGARLDATVVMSIPLLALVYLLARAVGKYTGATLGARLGKAPPVIRKYVGFGLLPQVGVAVALALLVDQQFGGGKYGTEGDDMASYVINILLVTTIATEIVGPLLTRLALTRAGEVNMAPSEGGAQ